MKTLQEIINESLNTKILQINDGDINHLIKSKQLLVCSNCGTTGMGAGMRSRHMENCKREKGYSDKCMVEDYNNSVPLIEIARKASMALISVHGTMNDFLSKQKEETLNTPIRTCPNCFEQSTNKNTMSKHFENCTRTAGYSNKKVFEMYESGVSITDISIESNISESWIRKIIKDFRPVDYIVTCPNCSEQSTDLNSMGRVHFEHCTRTAGYSNKKVIEQYLLGISVNQISLESKIPVVTTYRIIKKWKTSNNTLTTS